MAKTADSAREDSSKWQAARKKTIFISGICSWSKQFLKCAKAHFPFSLR